jgi:archaellum component FlaC
MVTNLKSAKGTMKEVRISGEKLLVRVSKDLGDFNKQLRISIHERIDNLEEDLLKLAKLRDTISAGLADTRRELERVHKRLSKAKPDLEKARECVIEIASKLGESRELYEQLRKSIEESLNQPPTAFEMVENTLQHLYSSASIWEGGARTIEDELAKVVDCSLPNEIKELENDVLNNGYSVLLAGENREQDNIAKFNNKLTELMNPESDNKPSSA